MIGLAPPSAATPRRPAPRGPAIQVNMIPAIQVGQKPNPVLFFYILAFLSRGWVKIVCIQKQRESGSPREDGGGDDGSKVNHLSPHRDHHHHHHHNRGHNHHHPEPHHHHHIPPSPDRTLPTLYMFVFAMSKLLWGATLQQNVPRNNENALFVLPLTSSAPLLP